MHQSIRAGRFCLPLIICTIAVSFPAVTASARHPGCGPGASGHFTGGCGPVARGCFAGGGWPLVGWSCGIGSYRAYDSVTVSGCGNGGFFSGGVRSVVVGGLALGCGNGWRGGWWSPGCGAICPPVTWCDPGCSAWGWGGPWGYGGWIWPPIVVSPFGSWLPAGAAPVFGPAGVYPSVGLTRSRRTGLLAGLPARADGARILAGLSTPRAVGGTATTTHASNRVARQRAARLVAQGDRALRDAVVDAGELRIAIDAYRRAATIAPDLPDTRLRQAIAFVAAGRHEDAAAAIDRAVQLDRRLAERAPVPPAGLVADPVFGDRVARAGDDAAPLPPVAGRGRAVLAEVMGGTDHRQPADNWIATAWSKRFGEPAAAFARR